MKSVSRHGAENEEEVARVSLALRQSITVLTRNLQGPPRLAEEGVEPYCLKACGKHSGNIQAVAGPLKCLG